jgi:hypothetical protein
MIPAFDALSENEVELLLKAPLLASILIAGADGHIDHKEMKEAIQQAQKNASRARASLMEFYKMVGEDFEDKLKILIAGYPHEVKVRNPLIVEELTRLNSIFEKLPKSFSQDLYKSLCDLAQGVATSSGGMFGINKIGDEEARWVNLPMLRPPQA